MLFTVLHSTLMLLLFSPLYSEMNRDDHDDEETEARITRASRQFFWLGVVAFAVCAIYDIFAWRSFTLPIWLVIGFIALFSLWRFGDYWWNFMRRRPPEKKD